MIKHRQMIKPWNILGHNLDLVIERLIQNHTSRKLKVKFQKVKID